MTQEYFEYRAFRADGKPARNGDAVALVVKVGRGAKLLYFKGFSTCLSPVEMQAEEAAALNPSGSPAAS